MAGGRVFLTDRLTDPKQKERVLCFAEDDGKPLWKYEYDCDYFGIGYVAGPRTCVTVDGELAYALGSMGDLSCLKAATGKLVWSHSLDAEYRISAEKRMPIWGIANAPLVYEETLIVALGAANASVVAFNKKTGEEIWKSMDDRGQYSAPVIIQQAGKPVLVCWTGDSVAGLNPADGKVYWREPMRPMNMPIGIATPLVNKNRLFVTSFYDGSMMLKLDPDELKAEQLWRAKERVNSRRTLCIRSSVRLCSKTVTSTALIAMGNSVAWTPTPAIDSGRI